jgi:DNA-binding response OmpR family regulator
MRILIVEDNPQDRELLIFTLQEHFKTEAKFREAQTLQVAHDYLARGGTDAIVLDLHLPDSSGLSTFTRIHRAYPHLPVIVVTNNTNLKLAVDIIRQGAEDVIVKDFTNSTELFRRILFAIERGVRNRAFLMTDPPPPPEEVPVDEPVPETLPSTK